MCNELEMHRSEARMKGRKLCSILLLTGMLAQLCVGAESYFSGRPDIERVRAEVKESPTTATR